MTIIVLLAVWAVVIIVAARVRLWLLEHDPENEKEAPSDSTGGETGNR